MRKRVPGYITQDSTNQFGLNVKVQRQPFPKQDFSPSGDPVPEGQPAINENLQGDVRYREVIPMGQIGSEEKGDLDILTPPQYVDTVEHYRGEQSDPKLHGPMDLERSAKVSPVAFQPYASFQPRSAPMPRNASDDVCLPYRANLHAADPLMNDHDSSEMWSRTAEEMPEPDPYRKDLYGKNRDGVLHNESHPGFRQVQGKIEKEGYSKEAAGAILAHATRNASSAAKKANPNLKKVRG